MMTYLGKIGELTLKGSNIHTFEKLLLKNTKEYLKDTGAKVSLHAGRLYIDCEEKDSEQVEFTLRHLIGITGWAQTKTSEKTIEDIQKTVLETAKEAVQKGAKSFKIEAKRGDKKFPLNSYEIACQGASLVYDSGLMEVNVHNPDVIIYVEVRERCFIYSVAEKSCRGLPVGCSNKGLLLLSGGLDSPVAGYRMMRRGMKIECCYFHSYPYTSIEAQQKVEELARTLSAYGIQTYLNIIPFTDVQMKIKEKAPEEWSTLMLRVCMMKAANMLAFRVHADCIVTGESLGQVASQTLENMNVTEHFAEYPLLRPLAGMDKEEIMADAHFIGTYDTSILPYEDCCVLFSPRHPILRGRIEDAEKIFASLEADELIKTAFENRQIKKFVCGKEVILKEEV
ncbi:MAG: tRNA 4-thiouridine(8) synthase ThiI [Treponema porcinum]|uniref:tRNA uracil 4-sulfurtransferase ThiI n=1 Tax=Treponema porcinum TaxID=261392 RepID=UPI002357A16D|nr:tRNA uracil 4-sulfurtransferase ThiI [Treponema porcinum]MCI6179502.1 tRNA 4-thiouridine(8) synthase ThiI [Treponema porcinum]MCI7079746.1 tRNA 4-thiouridine(8) synthase ThiI [Treponema porcinum]MCI7533540.1 tRNA 4-thiouridine(8) synthase ThiI [Treponema porcinum]MCI7546261.1 tRNA 4-thiouridine(8) synthase ThiI [Treponema porcinum]